MTGITSTSSTTGTRLYQVKIVSSKPPGLPVNFSTTFSALPCVAVASAMELDRPDAQTMKPM